MLYNQIIPEEIRSFLMTELDEEYKNLAKRTYISSDFNKELKPDEKIISPSDFGLHNAKLGKDGKLAFFDFEYAGWDDPAKTIADFFTQPAFPPPMNQLPSCFPLLVDILSPQNMDKLLRRLPIVFQIIRLKWSFILLNDYHPVYSKRRTLAKKIRTRGTHPQTNEGIDEFRANPSWLA